MFEISLKLIKKINKSLATPREKIEMLELVEQMTKERMEENKKINEKFEEITGKIDGYLTNVKYLLFDKEANMREKAALQSRIDELEKGKNG